MLEFANYLKESYNDDVSKAEEIIKQKWDKVVAIIKEAFDDQYADRKTALHRIQNEFTDPKIAPSSIDVDFLKENIDYVINKVNSLDEGEIRIVINNDVQKGGTAPKVPALSIAGDGMEMECNEPGKKKRGRPKKVVKEAEEEPEKTVAITVDDTVVTVEPSEESGLEKKEHSFESASQANKFADSMKAFFQEQGFELTGDEAEGGEEAEDAAAEEEPAPEEGGEEAPAEEEPAPEEGGEEAPEGEEAPAEEEPAPEGEEEESTPEEKEDSEEEVSISWEDVADVDLEDAEEEAEDDVPMENMDLSKLVGKLVKVENNWFSVKEVSEDNQLVCLNKEGEESTFGIDDIAEAEYEAEEEGEDVEEACAEEEAEDVEEGKEEEKEDVEEAAEEPEDVEEAAEEPEDVEEAKEEGEDAEEEVIEFESVMTKYANLFFDTDPDDEVVEEADDKANIGGHSNALTGKPSAPPKKMEKTNAAPKAPKKPGPTGSYTAKPGKPPKKSEKAGTVPKAPKKPAPTGSFTKNPNKPPKKTDGVPAPVIPSEYK